MPIFGLGDKANPPTFTSDVYLKGIVEYLLLMLHLSKVVSMISMVQHLTLNLHIFLFWEHIKI